MGRQRPAHHPTPVARSLADPTQPRRHTLRRRDGLPRRLRDGATWFLISADAHPRAIPFPLKWRDRHDFDDCPT